MRKCTICSHPEVDKINEALVRGDGYRTISRTFSVSEHALKRHAKNHLPKTLAKAKSAKEIANADNLLEKIKNLQEKTLNILRKAEEKGDLKVCLNAIREARENIELLAKLQGELQEGTIINIWENPEWQNVLCIILEELEGYPEIKLRIKERLEK